MLFTNKAVHEQACSRTDRTNLFTNNPVHKQPVHEQRCSRTSGPVHEQVCSRTPLFTNTASGCCSRTTLFTNSLMTNTGVHEQHCRHVFTNKACSRTVCSRTHAFTNTLARACSRTDLFTNSLFTNTLFTNGGVHEQPVHEHFVNEQLRERTLVISNTGSRRGGIWPRQQTIHTYGKILFSHKCECQGGEGVWENPFILDEWFPHRDLWTWLLTKRGDALRQKTGLRYRGAVECARV